MTASEGVWIAAVVSSSLGFVSLQQARYYDGDRDAHWRRWSALTALLRTPQAPSAVRATRRGQALLAVAIVLLGLGLWLR